MSAYFIPFNFCPTSVSVKTSSYTIPAGYYACVVANVAGSGSFTIDSDTALVAALWTALASSGLQTSNTPGTTALLTSGTNSLPGNAFTSSSAKAAVSATYWLPTGTVINGSGGLDGSWYATVSLYRMIS